MGWRSWNAFQSDINQSTFTKAVDAVAKKRNVAFHDQPVSLCDLGYCSVGIDEGWEGCGDGVDGSQHYRNGTPAVNHKFPDLRQLVNYSHDRGVEMGWYQNGCACGEKQGKLVNYKGDVAALHDLGFDAVKLDHCGQQCNLTLYAELMQSTGKTFTIENCHHPPDPCHGSDDSSCPTRDWCPFNLFRTSGDIHSSEYSWFENLQTTIRFSGGDAPVSQPGCWAYPDMLEIGRVEAPLSWNKAHFAAWCVVSSPLVLGLELTDAKLQPILDIIGNPRAIAVNQAWAGHPGTLVRNLSLGSPSPAQLGKLAIAVDCDPCDTTQQEWSFAASTLKMGDECLSTKNHSTLSGVEGNSSARFTELGLSACDGSDAQAFAYHDDKKTFTQGDQCLDIFEHDAAGDRRIDMYECNGGANQQWAVSSGSLRSKYGGSGSGSCAAARASASASAPSSGMNAQETSKVQLWAKPMPGGAVAALLINGGSSTYHATITLAELNVTAAAVNVTDVWSGAPHGDVCGGAFMVTVRTLDSAFVMVTPATATLA